MKTVDEAFNTKAQECVNVFNNKIGDLHPLHAIILKDIIKGTLSEVYNAGKTEGKKEGIKSLNNTIANRYAFSVAVKAVRTIADELLSGGPGK